MRIIVRSVQDEISSWDFAKISSLAASFVHRFQRCGVLCKFVDDGARGSAGPAEMEGKLEVRPLFLFEDLKGRTC